MRPSAKRTRIEDANEPGQESFKRSSSAASVEGVDKSIPEFQASTAETASTATAVSAPLYHRTAGAGLPTPDVPFELNDGDRHHAVSLTREQPSTPLFTATIEALVHQSLRHGYHFAPNGLPIAVEYFSRLQREVAGLQANAERQEDVFTALIGMWQQKLAVW